MISAVTKARNTIAEALREASADLEEIRGQIDALHRERRQVERRNDDFETIAARIGDVIAEARRESLISQNMLTSVPATASTFDALFSNLMKGRPFFLLAHLAPDTLRESLLADVERKGGISPKQRAAALEAIDAKLLTAEIAEEVAIREMEDATGSYIARRAKADPAILLAPDRELSPPPD